MKLFILATSLVLSLSTQAQRYIGNGGGLGEMKAYIVVANLPLVTKTCLETKNSCDLTDAQLAVLKNLNTLTSTQTIKLIAPSTEVSHYANGVLKLNSQDLYTNKIPNTYGKILSLCVSTLVRGAFSNQINNWPVNKFDSFRENIKSINVSRMNVSVHYLRFDINKSGTASVQSLLIEDQQTTVDLTPDLQKTLNCQNPNWAIQNWSADSINFLVTAEITWSCEQHKFAAELNIFLNSNPKNQLQLIRKIQLH